MTPTGCREPEGSDNMRVSRVSGVWTGPDRGAATGVSALPFLQTASVERRFWGVGRLVKLGACRRNALARAMRRAHLRRFVGGGLDGPLRDLPQEPVARAKPALGAEHPSTPRVQPSG